LIRTLFERLKQSLGMTPSSELAFSYYDKIPGLIWVGGSGFECLYVNKAWQDFTGASLVKEINSRGTISIHPDDLKGCSEIFRDAVKNKTTFFFEYRIRNRDGDYQWFQNTGQPHYDKRGAFTGFIAVCVNIEAQKKMQQKHIRANQIIGLMTERGLLTSWELEVESNTLTRFKYDSIEQALTEESSPGELFVDSIDPEQGPLLLSAIDTALKGSGKFEISYKHRPRGETKGPYSQWALSIGVVHGEAGKSRHIIGISTNVTELKNLNEEIRERNEFFDFALDTIPLSVMIKNRSGEFVYVNEFFCKQMGLTQNQVIGKRAEEILNKGEAAPMDKTNEIAFEKKGETIISEFDITIPNLGLRHVIGRRVVRELNGEPLIIIVNQDITDLKNALTDLQKQNTIFETTVRSAGVAFWDWNPKTGQLTFDEDWFRQIEILDKDSGKLDSWMGALHPDDAKPTADRIQAHLEGRTDFYESLMRLKSKKGVYKHVVAKGKIVERDADGAPTRFAGVHVDLTEMMNLKNIVEEQRILLMNSSKFVSLGEIAAEVAHEVNNSLNFIGGAFSVIRSKFALHTDKEIVAETKEYFRLVEQGLASTETIVMNLRNYSSRGKTLVDYLELKPVVLTNLELIKSKLAHVKVNVKMEDNLGFYGSEASFDQIILNLISNSIEAFTDRKGTINISAKAVVIDGKKKIELIFEDDGPGIPTADNTRIFEPFFTTKLGGSHTGLGLYVVKTEIEKHRGDIKLENTVGSGARFVLLFPYNQNN
jgi:PAS domain S-box-containing protein